MCCCKAHTWTYHTLAAGAVFSPCPLPSPCPSLSQIYFIINQLVAHLPACCVFFSINKALIAFSLECDLAPCALSFWGCRPWRTRLDYFTSAPSTGCYQTQALSQVPRSRHTATKHKQDAAGQRQTPTAPATRTDCTRQWLKKTMYISSAGGRGKMLNLRAIRQESRNVRTNTPSSFITNRVIMVFSRTEDKLPKRSKAEKKADMSDKSHSDSREPKQPTFIQFAAQGNSWDTRLTC